jgi:hypothetical protein
MVVILPRIRPYPLLFMQKAAIMALLVGLCKRTRKALQKTSGDWVKGNSPVAGGSLTSKPARWIPAGNPPRLFFFGDGFSKKPG